MNSKRKSKKFLFRSTKITLIFRWSLIKARDISIEHNFLVHSFDDNWTNNVTFLSPKKKKWIWINQRCTMELFLFNVCVSRCFLWWKDNNYEERIEFNWQISSLVHRFDQSRIDLLVLLLLRQNKIHVHFFFSFSSSMIK